MLTPESCFLDVGANIGLHALYAAINVPNGKVFAFEASKKVYDLLEINVDINALSHRVNFIHAAVTNYDGEVEFETGANQHGVSAIKLPVDLMPSIQTKIEKDIVRAITLDTYFPKGSRVDVIKMDVEHFEPEVIDGAKRVIEDNYNLSIVIELHIASKTKEKLQMVNYLLEKGFKIFKINHDCTISEIYTAMPLASFNDFSLGDYLFARGSHLQMI